LAPQNDWCCAYRVLSLQDDFVNEKPLLQHYPEGCGHVCLFLPKFHCELNPIEMLWGYAKYCESYRTAYQLIIYYLKVIGQILMENLPQRRSLFPNVSICVTR
jgi:transposase